MYNYIYNLLLKFTEHKYIEKFKTNIVYFNCFILCYLLLKYCFKLTAFTVPVTLRRAYRSKCTKSVKL